MGKSFSRLGVGGGRYFTAITAAPKIGSTTATSAYISVTKKEGTFENCFFVCLSGRCTREGGSCLLEAPGGMAKDGLGLGPGSMGGIPPPFPSRARKDLWKAGQAEGSKDAPTPGEGERTVKTEGAKCHASSQLNTPVPSLPRPRTVSVSQAPSKPLSRQ